MKVTNINARMDASAKHNDRNFDLELASHIDRSKVKENKYYRYNGVNSMTFEELEREYYESNFENALEIANKKHKESRHKDRVKTMEQYRKSKYTRPEDKILQIGNARNHASGEELWACAMEYKDRFNEIYGDNCIILDMALHMDEPHGAPHVHVRRVWVAENENGDLYVSQEKALEQLGILPPNPNKPINKYNNAKMTFTQSDIELFKTICRERGIDIEENKTKGKRTHLSTREYKVKQDEEALEEITRMTATFIKENPYLVNLYAEKLEAAEKISEEQRTRLLVKIMVEEFDRLNRNGDFEKAYEKERLKRLEQYIQENGLMEDYDEWDKSQQENGER